MASRRRKKNPILIRAFAISAGVTIIALAIAAHFGALKSVQAALTNRPPAVVMLTPEEPVKPKAPAKQEHKSRSADKGAAKKEASTSHAQSHGPKLNQPAVVASGPGEGGSGPAIEQGTGPAGQLPTEPKSGNTTPPPPTDTAPTKPEPTAPVVISKPTPQPEPQPQPQPKHVPVYAAMKPTFSPEPTIPDDLRNDAIDKTCVVEFTVSQDGSVQGADVVTSSGMRELDDLAIQAAKKWKFTPATLDGQATTGKVRLSIEFEVQ